MTNFISIKDAKDNLKGDICATVVKIGDLKSGTSGQGDWTMKIITFDDGSEMVDIAAFGESQYSKFQLNAKYEISNAWWKLKDNQLSVTFGQYCKIKKVSEAPVQETIPIDDEAQERIVDCSIAGLEEFSKKQNKILNIITNSVWNDLEKARKDTDNPVRGDVVWVRTKEIYNLWSQKK